MVKYKAGWSVTLRDYLNGSSVHGLSYIGSYAVPLVDRILWSILVS